MLEGDRAESGRRPRGRWSGTSKSAIVHGPMLPTIALVTLASFVIAPLAMRLTAAYHWSELSDATRWQIIVGYLWFGAIFAVPALVLSGLMAWAAPDQAWLAVVVPAVVVATLLFMNIRSAAPVRRLQTLARRLKDLDRRNQARAEILKLVARAKPDDQAGASVYIAAATALSNGRFQEDALGLLVHVQDEHLSGHEKQLRALGIMVCRMHTGDLLGAREALSTLPELDGDHRITRQMMEATLLVFEGEPRRALELTETECELGWAERSRLVARAHAFAAMGENLEMKRCLGALLEQHPDEGLPRVVDPTGPASAHARAMMRGEAGPYGR